MRTLLTPNLLGFLIKKGYHYCLAKIDINNASDPVTIITLMPVKYNPELDGFPQDYDKYFQITREPVQMSLGIRNTQVYVSLDFKENRSSHG